MGAVDNRDLEVRPDDRVLRGGLRPTRFNRICDGLVRRGNDRALRGEPQDVAGGSGGRSRAPDIGVAAAERSRAETAAGGVERDGQGVSEGEMHTPTV